MSERGYVIGGWLLLVVVMLVVGLIEPGKQAELPSLPSKPIRVDLSHDSWLRLQPYTEREETVPAPRQAPSRAVPVFSEWKSIREGRVGQ